MSIDEQPRPPLLTDSTRWRRAIFDYPDRMAFQRIDDSFASYGASVNLPERTLALTKSDDKNWRASFTFQRPAGDQLILDGRMDNHQVHMELQLTDRNSFLLVSRGFHWTQEAALGPLLMVDQYDWIGINIFPNDATGNCLGKPALGSRTTIRIPRSRSRPTKHYSQPLSHRGLE